LQSSIVHSESKIYMHDLCNPWFVDNQNTAWESNMKPRNTPALESIDCLAPELRTDGLCTEPISSVPCYHLQVTSTPPMTTKGPLGLLRIECRRLFTLASRQIPTARGIRCELDTEASIATTAGRSEAQEPSSIAFLDCLPSIDIVLARPTPDRSRRQQKQSCSSRHTRRKPPRQPSSRHLSTVSGPRQTTSLTVSSPEKTTADLPSLDTDTPIPTPTPSEPGLLDRLTRLDPLWRKAGIAGL